MKMNHSLRALIGHFIFFFLFLLFLCVGNPAGRTEQVRTSSETFPVVSVSESVQNSSEEVKSVPQAPETPWIFVPVDAEGKTIGEEFYLPMEILQNHFRTKNALEKGAKQSFFFRKALYTGTVSQNLASRELSVDSIRASFEVEVRTPETKVTFPFSRSQVYLVPGSTVLNGEPFQIIWEDGHPVVNFPKTGRYLLEFTLVPIVMPMGPISSAPSSSPVRESENTGLKLEMLPDSSTETSASSGTEFSLCGFSFSIPVIPSARLELQVPQGISSFEFPAALGDQEFEQDSRTWLVWLGAAPQLTVQWKTQNARTGTSGLLTAEELYKWHLEENGQRMECRTRFHSSEEAFSRMEWIIDSNLVFKPDELRLFVQKENQNENRSIEVGNDLNTLGTSTFSSTPSCFFVPFSGEKNVQTRIEGKFRRVILTLNQPVSEPLLVIFPLENTSVGNVGSYQIPLVRTEKTKVTHRWFQVISEPNFHLELPQTQTVSLISPQEFFAVWEELGPRVNPNLEKSAISATLARVVEAEEAAFSSGNSVIIDDSQSVNQSRTWTVKSEPLPAISTIRESLSCTFDKDLVTVQLFVMFSSPEVIPSLFHLHIPEGLNVQKVILHDGMTQKNLRFAHSQNEMLGIFYEKFSAEVQAPSGPIWQKILSPTENSEADSSPVSALPESIPSPVVKRSTVAEASSNCSVEIVGTLDVLDFTQKKETKFPFPDVHVSEPSLHSVLRTVHLFRSSRVLVTCPIPAGCNEIEEPVAPGISKHLAIENVRLVSAFSVPSQEIIKTNVMILPNQPRVLMNTRTFLKIPRELVLTRGETETSTDSELLKKELSPEQNVAVPESSDSSHETVLPRILTTALPNESRNESPVYSSNSHWQMTMEMLLTVEKGLADEIVLEMPASFSQPYILEPPMPYELEPISNQEVSAERISAEEKNVKIDQKKSREKKSKKGDVTSSNLEKTEKTEKSGKTEKSDAQSRSSTELSSISTQSGAYVRMIIHPQKPISGNLALRLTTDIQESSLDSSVQNVLVRLSNFRFPGITVQKQDILLPALSSESRKEQFRWLTEGMILLSVSRLTVPESVSEAPSVSVSDSASAKPPVSSESEIEPKFENPFTMVWKAPTSGTPREGENHFKIYRVIEKNYFAQLQIQSFDWLNPTVEMTTHSIYWNSAKEFLGVTTLDILPQKAQTCVLRLPVKMKLLELHLDSRPVQIEEVIWDENRSEFLPVSAVSGSELNVSENSGTWGQKTAYRTFRVTLRSLQLPQHLEVLYHGNTTDWAALRLPGSSAEPRATEHLYQLDLPVLLRQEMNEIVPIDSRSGAAFFFMPNDSRLNLWSVTLPETVSGIRTQQLAPLEEKPWGFVQITCLERLHDLIAHTLSPRLTSTVSERERSAWLENWHLLWLSVEHLIDGTFAEHPEFATSEIKRKFNQLQTEREQIFTDALPPEALEKETLAQNTNEFHQNSLWLVFIRNLPNEVKQLTAFETGSRSRFYMMEKETRDFVLPKYSWAVLYTFLFTLMISLGLYFNPAIPEEVRSTPFWLVCSGSLWLFCGLNVWIGLSLLTLSVVTLAYRIFKLRKSGI